MSESKSKKSKQFWFWLSVCINIGFLGVFKYFNFFSVSFANALNSIGIQTSPITLQVILPVGISFYTFHGLSYVIDIYNDKIKAEKNFVDYSVFVSFFPLLVAGPIERATHLLPQIKKSRTFDYNKAVDGLRQILWGLFKKIVIADQCSEFVNLIFAQPENYSGSTLAIGAILFTFQIYGDFSGYSDIALGTARLFGIELLRNFSFPYFSRDIAEFWRRWHISLSSWFRDYLYIPLGGSKVSTGIKVRNTFIIFLVSGFWHGANWTFIFWGLLNAVFILPSIIFNTNRTNLDIVAQGKALPTLKELFQVTFTFILATFAWILFRAKDITHAFQYISGIFSQTLLSRPKFFGMDRAIITFVFIGLMLIIEWMSREQNHGLERVYFKSNKFLRYVFYYALVFIILWFSGKEEQFIYFQF